MGKRRWENLSDLVTFNLTVFCLIVLFSVCLFDYPAFRVYGKICFFLFDTSELSFFFPKPRKFSSGDALPFTYPLRTPSVPDRTVPHTQVQVESPLKDRRSTGIFKGTSPLNTVRSKGSLKTKLSLKNSFSSRTF